MKYIDIYTTASAKARSRLLAAVRIILPVILLWTLSINAMAQSASISVGSASSLPGTAVDLSIGITAGSSSISSLQFDLTFPSSLAYVSASTEGAAAAAGKSVTGSAIDGGARLVIFGVNTNAIGSGTLTNVRLNLSSDVSGTIPVSIAGIVASDPSGNPLTVSGSPGSVTVVAPADTTGPAISITSPVPGSSYTSNSGTMDLGGTASDNVGVTRVTWANSRGGSGTAIGTMNWSVPGIELQGGSNVITVTAYDAAGNKGTDALTVTYPEADNTPPVISGVSVGSITASSATIVWTTDEASDSQAEYGTTASYGSSTDLDIAATKSHSRELSGLSAGTLYHYRVKSRDAAGNLAASGDFTFSTMEEVKTSVVSDFNGDGKSDLVWRDTRTGEVLLWLMDGTQRLSSVSVGTVSDSAWQIAGVGDFNGDGKTDILWRHYGSGENYVWFMDGTVYSEGTYLEAQRDLDYKIAGVGDFNGDGAADILWCRQIEGTYSVWFMNNKDRIGESDLESPGDLSWQVAGVADFDGDGNSDILWRNYATGENRVALMNGTSLIRYIDLEKVADRKDKILGLGDYDGDGQMEILWRNASKKLNSFWRMTGTAKISETDLGDFNGSDSLQSEAGQATSGLDFNNDGNTDLLWRDLITGENYVWLMKGPHYNGGTFLEASPGLNWRIVAAGDFNSDGRADLVWRNTATGENSVWFMNGLNRTGEASLKAVPDTGWQIAGAADFNQDGMPDLLWHNSVTGENSLWLMDGVTLKNSVSLESAPDPGWHIGAVGDFNKDGMPDLLWHNSATGEISIWYMNGTTRAGEAQLEGMPDLNWEIAGTGDYNWDGSLDILWRNTATGENSVWYMDGAECIGKDSLPTVKGWRWQTMTQGD